MRWASEKASAKLRDHIISQHERIEVISGKCRFNYRCQMNAVHEAVISGEDKIAMAIYFDGTPIIHFLNVDAEGNYTDNTLGIWSSRYTYYLIDLIDKDEFFNVNHHFGEYRKLLRRKLGWLRLFTDMTC